jgi:hypothetical protein
MTVVPEITNTGVTMASAAANAGCRHIDFAS